MEEIDAKWLLKAPFKYSSYMKAEVRDQQTVSVRTQIVNILDFAGHMVYSTTAQLYNRSSKAVAATLGHR